MNGRHGIGARMRAHDPLRRVEDLELDGTGGIGREATDARGRFEIVGLEPGVFHVAACLPGFAPAFVARAFSAAT